MQLYYCDSRGPCRDRVGDKCRLIPGACKDQKQPALKEIQVCTLCMHRKVCKYREDFEQKSNTYIKLECKYFLSDV